MANNPLFDHFRSHPDFWDEMISPDGMVRPH